MAELSKLVTNTLVNFGNFFNYIILSPLFLLKKKCCMKKAKKKGNIFKKLCLGAWVKLNRFNFLTQKCISSSFNTLNLKLFRNYGGKSTNESGEKKPLGVHRYMIILNWQYFCLPFCWSWPKGWDKKREDGRKWGYWFWNITPPHTGISPLVH